MNVEENLPSILKTNIDPPSELIEKVRTSNVIEDLDVGSDIETLLVEQIARVLHEYQQKESNLPEWRKARKASIKELADASKTIKKAVACISDNILRTDSASIYHQDAIEGYANLPPFIGYLRLLVQSKQFPIYVNGVIKPIADSFCITSK